MNQKDKKESLTKLLRVSDSNQKYFITTDQITGKRFAVTEFGEPGSVNIKSNFMTFKEMESFLFGVNAVKNNTLNLAEDQTKRPIFWSVDDFESQAEYNFNELKKYNPEEYSHLSNWEQLYDKAQFSKLLQEMIRKHDATIGITWLTVDDFLQKAEITNHK